MFLVVAIVVFGVVLRVVGISKQVFIKNTRMKSSISDFKSKDILLSFSAPLMGVLLAVADNYVDWATALSLLVTVALLHMYMSTESRVFLILSVAASSLTVYLANGSLLCLESLLLLLLTYFLLRMAKGTGGSDGITERILTILLNGPVAVYGTYFVCTHSFGSWVLLLPSFSIGLLCVAAELDRIKCHRFLVPALILAGVALMTTYSLIRIYDPAHYLYMVSLPLFIIYMVRRKESYSSLLDLSVFVFSLLAGIGYVIYLF